MQSIVLNRVHYTLFINDVMMIKQKKTLKLSVVFIAFIQFMCTDQYVGKLNCNFKFPNIRAFNNVSVNLLFIGMIYAREKEIHILTE